MIPVREAIYKIGDEIPNNLNSWKVNAIYHPPKGDISGYYVLDFETVCVNLKAAVRRFLKACKRDPEISTRVKDIVNTDLNNKGDLEFWYEWFEISGSVPMFKSGETHGQQVEYEVNEYEGNYKSYYLSALLTEVE